VSHLSTSNFLQCFSCVSFEIIFTSLSLVSFVSVLTEYSANYYIIWSKFRFLSPVESTISIFEPLITKLNLSNLIEEFLRWQSVYPFQRNTGWTVTYSTANCQWVVTQQLFQTIRAIYMCTVEYFELFNSITKNAFKRFCCCLRSHYVCLKSVVYG